MAARSAQAARRPPEKSWSSSLRRRLLERIHLAPLRVDAGHDVFDHAVLARRRPWPGRSAGPPTGPGRRASPAGRGASPGPSSRWRLPSSLRFEAAGEAGVVVFEPELTCRVGRGSGLRPWRPPGFKPAGRGLGVTRNDEATAHVQDGQHEQDDEHGDESALSSAAPSCARSALAGSRAVTLREQRARRLRRGPETAGESRRQQPAQAPTPRGAAHRSEEAAPRLVATPRWMLAPPRAGWPAPGTSRRAEAGPDERAGRGDGSRRAHAGWRRR